MRVEFILVSLLLLAAACSSGANRQPFRKEAYQAKNESLLYVFRDASLPSSVNVAVFFDHKSVGTLNPDGYYPIHAMAGKHLMKACGGNILMTLCRELDLSMKPGDLVTVRLTYENDQPGLKVAQNTDELQGLKNEGNYYEAPLRDSLPARHDKVTLTAAALGGQQKGNGPLKVAFRNFSDETRSELYGWLSESLPDALDHSMRRDFVYARTKDNADLVISGKYVLEPGGSTLRIETQIVLSEKNTVLSSEVAETTVDAQIFNATKILGDKLVARMHELVKGK